MLVCQFVAARLAVRFRSERGASLVEYSLLVALIAIVCVGAVTFLGREVGDGLSAVGSSLN